MRILQISLGDGYAGSARFAILSSKALMKRGHDLGLLVSPGSLTESRGDREGLDIVSLPRRPDKNLFEDFEQMILDWKPDVVVAHHSKERKHLMRMRRMGSANFMAMAFRNIVSRSFPFISAVPSNFWLDGIIACSHGVARSLMWRGIWPWKIHVVYNGIEVPENLEPAIDSPALGTQKGKTVIGMSSWFHPRRKGFDTIFRALSKGLDRPFHLLLMGVAAEHKEACSRMAQKFGLDPKNLVYPGYVDNVWPYYGAMDIFILPSREEGFSLSLLEAMASEKACIASAIAGNDEAITHGVNGLLFTPGKALELRKAIQRILSFPDESYRMASLARKRVLSSFTVNHAAEGLERVFTKVGKKLNKS